MTREPTKTALILSGGGARAAYQVGVVKAVREILPPGIRNPFPILCGTSAGAINAAALAASAENFSAGVDSLHEVWTGFHASQVYRADPAGVAAAAARWLALLAFGWITRRSPRSLLDNEPLRQLLKTTIDFDGVESAINHHALHSLSITCSGYGSGHSVSFFQGRADLEPWRRSQRIGAHVKLSVEHLMASSGIPFLFPAVRLNREYFGDGSMRQLSPLSPAIHLGAEKLMVIGAGRMADSSDDREASETYPSLARIAGHAMSSIFLDALAVDLERVERVNQTLSLIPLDARSNGLTSLRQVEVLVISPSKRLDHIAAEHFGALPWPMRMLLRGLGAMGKQGGALVSYLLFEPPYTRALIDLGYQDTMARRDEVIQFLDMT